MLDTITTNKNPVIKIANHNKLRYSSVLAADIGATKTTLAICNWDGQLNVQKINTYKTKSFPDIISMIESFVDDDKMPQKISLGVAGPVLDGSVTMTNTGWSINSREVSERFNHIPVALINDLEATAYGLAVLNKEDIHTLIEKKKHLDGNIAIIAPGTGLGEAGLIKSTDGYHPMATEGGHCHFAPVTDIDVKLYSFLHKKYDQVSWERVVSGPGICNIYDFLHQVVEMEEPAWLKEKILAHDKATVISENAGDAEICRETITMFFRFLALESTNLALKLKATGGVYIAGGILPHLLPLLHKEYFQKWFSYAGPMRNLIQSIPINILKNKKTPLSGAAYHGLYSI
jgi:glucokinase